MPNMSASWNASLPSMPVTTWPDTMIIGTESMWAVMIPVIVFVAPGPLVAQTTAGLPVARA